jgi:hypothetical protein
MTKLLADPALIVGLVRAGIILAVSFGVGITQAQQDSLLVFVGAFLAVVSLLLTGVTLSKTTPKATPTLDQGTVVTVVTPGDAPNTVAVL